MYAVFAKMETKGHFVGREAAHDTPSVASAWDRLHLAKLAGPEGAPSGAVGLVLMNTSTGKILRTHLFPVKQEQVATEYEKALEVAGPQSIKLSDAMRKVLDSDDNALVGLPGAPNTLKALEARGLVSRDNCGVAHLTDLGRKYRRV